jgi:hypothetical protein
MVGPVDDMDSCRVDGNMMESLPKLADGGLFLMG